MVMPLFNNTREVALKLHKRLRKKFEFNELI